MKGTKQTRPCGLSVVLTLKSSKPYTIAVKISEWVGRERFTGRLCCVSSAATMFYDDGFGYDEHVQEKQPAPAHGPHRASTRARRAFLARCSRTPALFTEIPMRVA
jgi:hypothetical protein